MLMKSIESNNGPNNEHSQEPWINSKYGTGTGAKHQTIIFSDRDLQLKKAHRKLDLERPAEEYMEELDCHGGGVLKIEDEKEIELTLGPTSYNRRKQKGDQTPLTSDSGPSFSSSSTGSSHMKKTNSSSGTQQRADRSSTRKELNSSQWGLVQNERRNTNFDVEEQLRQERLKQPPWILQALSLNMT